MESPLHYFNHFEGHEIETLVGICPGHHGALEDDRGEQQLVLNKEALHPLHVVLVHAQAVWQGCVRKGLTSVDRRLGCEGVCPLLSRLGRGRNQRRCRRRR